MFGKTKKYKFTKEELQQKTYEALMWASDGTEARVGNREPEPFLMGNPKDMAFIVVEALTVGLPDSEDSSPSAATV